MPRSARSGRRRRTPRRPRTSSTLRSRGHPRNCSESRSPRSRQRAPQKVTRRRPSSAESALGDYLSTSDSSLFSTKELTGAITDLGLTFDDLAGLLVEGTDGATTFLETLAAAEGINFEDMGTSAGEVVDEIAALTGEGKSLEEAFKAVFDDALGGLAEIGAGANEARTALIEILTTNDEVAESFGAFLQQQLVLEAAAEAARDKALADGLATEAQLAFAESTLRARGESATLTDQLAFLNSNMGFVVDANRRRDAGTTRTPRRLDELDAQMVTTSGAWQRLAEAILTGEVASEDFQAVADRFGVTRDTIVGFAEAATGALDEFVNTATSQLPNAVDAINGLETAVNPQQFIDDLQAQIDAMQGWRLRIEALASQGYERLATLTFEAGPRTGRSTRGGTPVSRTGRACCGGVHARRSTTGVRGDKRVGTRRFRSAVPR